MSRISIDVSAEDHKRLKALAELEVFLDERMRQAKAGMISKRTVGEIFQQAYHEADGRNPS